MAKQIGVAFQSSPAWALEQRVRVLERRIAALSSALSALREQLRTMRPDEAGESVTSGEGPGATR